MEASEIEAKLHGDSCMKHIVWGVYPRDHLPRTLLPGGYIVNTDNADGPGVHWIALWVELAQLEFMDSFGYGPEQYGWTFTLPATWNTRQIQSNDAMTCGSHCLYYLYYKCRGLNLQNIFENFSVDTLYNDQLVAGFVRRL